MKEGVALVWLWITSVGLVAIGLFFYNVNRPEAGLDIPEWRQARWVSGGIGAVGVALIALLLAGCATTPPERIRVVEKVVPVSEKPIAASDIPKVPAPLPPRPKSLKAASDLLLAKHCEWVSYADDANRLLAHSAGLPPPPPLDFAECKER